MASVTFKNVKKVYDKSVVAVHDFTLDIADKEFVVFVGPSGCGKSTTLRMVAGLEEITSGELYIGDKLVNNVMPKDRDITMVFQNYALYPHMTVYDNIAFSLKRRRVPKKEIRRKVLEAAEILDITELLKRKPRALSGGQRQRVAIGRSIVREPKVFLMDEPLSNLDAKLRSQMRMEIMKLRKRIDTTFIYVTHDQTEAMTLGDRIVVMNDGLIMQVGTPDAVYSRPENMFVAGFIGSPQMNFIDAVLSLSGENYTVTVGDWDIVPGETIQKILRDRKVPTGDVVLGVRPEDLHLADRGIAASADVSEMTGNALSVHALIGETEVISVKSFGAAGAVTAPPPGTVLHLVPERERIHLFDKATGESLLYGKAQG
jgi:multiple sugar transport system ATP-binding protein